MATDTKAQWLPDVQAEHPAVALALPRVGVMGLETSIRLAGDQLLAARIDCCVDLPAGQKGAHMSRFEEAVEAATADARSAELGVEALARRIAEEVRERQGGKRAEVTITARAQRERATPVSDTIVADHYTLMATAVAGTEFETRCLLGVAAQGITACPCAQEIVAAGARERLAGDGFSAEEVQRILDLVPVATHNQRGIGTLQIGLTPGADLAVDPLILVDIVESSMSSEIYELMKRADEAAVVEKAHRRPRFVEDCVRDMLSGVLERLDGLPADTFVAAHQENLETIHQHNVVAGYAGALSELREELATGRRPAAQTSARGWLDAGGDLSVRRSPKK